MTLRDKAAKALDATHQHDGRGPLTFKTRNAVAAWLDGAAKIRTSTIRKMVAYLEMVAA
jgi:hypothetical protein